MSFSLTPGKLGFMLSRVLVALKAGTLDTPVALVSSAGVQLPRFSNAGERGVTRLRHHDPCRAGADSLRPER